MLDLGSRNAPFHAIFSGRLVRVAGSGRSRCQASAMCCNWASTVETACVTVASTCRRLSPRSPFATRYCVPPPARAGPLGRPRVACGAVAGVAERLSVAEASFPFACAADRLFPYGLAGRSSAKGARDPGRRRVQREPPFRPGSRRRRFSRPTPAGPPGVAGTPPRWLRRSRTWRSRRAGDAKKMPNRRGSTGRMFAPPRR